jgi:hypothetical protein
MDYNRLNRERSDLNDYLARERALQFAQADCHAGHIALEQVIAQASQYEAFLTKRPVDVAA